MKFSKNLLLIACMILINCALALIELIIFPFFMGMFVKNHYVYLITAIIMTLIVNPIITLLVSNKLPFKPDNQKKKSEYFIVS